VQIYPAILTTTRDRLDGLYVGQDTDPAELIAKSKTGLVYLRLSPFQAIPLPSIGPEAYLVRGVDDDRGGEQVVLFQKSSRDCGCGGALRSDPPADELALLASWDERADDALPL
jgi:hypothetical protein